MPLRREARVEARAPLKSDELAKDLEGDLGELGGEAELEVLLIGDGSVELVQVGVGEAGVLDEVFGQGGGEFFGESFCVLKGEGLGEVVDDLEGQILGQGRVVEAGAVHQAHNEEMVAHGQSSIWGCALCGVGK